jgi:hypothetical protein
MEARQTLTTGSILPKALIVVLAICSTIGLAAMGAVITKDLSASNASVQAPVHPAPGTVLRQDNPPSESGDGQGSRAGGPQSDLTRVLPSEQAAYNPGWDARSVREGHGA